MAKSRMWPNWTPASTSSTGQSLTAIGFGVRSVMACSLLAPAAVHDGRRFDVVAGADQDLRPDDRDLRAIHRFVALQPVMDAPGERSPVRFAHGAIPRVHAEADHVLAQRWIEADLDLKFGKLLEQVGEVS